MLATADLVALRETLAKYSPDQPRDESGRWTGPGLEATDYQGETGNRTHITRNETGRVPTAAIAHLLGARGERPGLHRNRQGAAWTAFVDDVRRNGVKSPIFITVDPGKAPEINEGNHRRDAAVEAGLADVPVEIRYFGHAEREGTVLERAGIAKYNPYHDEQGRFAEAPGGGEIPDSAIRAPRGSNDEVVASLAKLPPDAVVRFYHGTTGRGARGIVRDMRIKPDDIYSVGLASTYEAARSYSRYHVGYQRYGPQQAITPAVVLEVAVRRSELGDQEFVGAGGGRRFGPEAGGDGANAILVTDYDTSHWPGVPLVGARIVHAGKYSPDQARDDHGRWVDEGGATYGPGFEAGDPQRTSEVRSAIRSLQERFPSVKVGLIDVQKSGTGMFADRRNMTALAVALPGQQGPTTPEQLDVERKLGLTPETDAVRFGGSILLNSDWFGQNPFPLIDAPGAHCPGTDNATGTITHEFGHLLDNQLSRLAGDESIKPWTDWRDAASAGFYYGRLGDRTDDGALLRTITGYARTEGTFKEALAELFAGVYTPGASVPPGYEGVAASLKGVLQQIGWDAGPVRKYSPDQPRDDAGRWTDGGGSPALTLTPDPVYSAVNLWSHQLVGVTTIRAAARGTKANDEFGIHSAPPEYRQAAARLIDGVAHGDAAPTLYRGINLDGNAESIRQFRDLKPGDAIDLNLSSWTTNDTHAQEFYDGATTGGRGPGVMLILEDGARGVNVDKVSGYARGEQEWITDGRFAVTFKDVIGEDESDPDVVPGWTVGLRQQATFTEPGQFAQAKRAGDAHVPLSEASFLDWLEPHMDARMVPPSALSTDKLLALRASLLLKYSPDQERVPAGSPDGGQFAGGQEGAPPDPPMGYNWRGRTSNFSHDDHQEAVEAWQYTFAGNQWMKAHPDSPAMRAFREVVDASPRHDGPVYKGVRGDTSRWRVGSRVDFTTMSSTTPDIATAAGYGKTILEIKGGDAREIDEFGNVYKETVLMPSSYTITGVRREHVESEVWDLPSTMRVYTLEPTA